MSDLQVFTQGPSGGVGRARSRGNLDYLTNVDPPTGLWLDERRILPTSQPYIQIYFNIDIDLLNKSTNGVDKVIRDNFVNKNSDGEDCLVLPRNYVQTADFDGIQAVGARPGRITIIDPEGLWAQALSYIGHWKNQNPGLANMLIEYGWVGLSTNCPGSPSPSESQRIPAVLWKTGFGMDDNGVITIELSFVENSERILAGIKFNFLDDLPRINSLTNNKVKEMKTISSLLYYIVENSEAVKEQLKQFSLEINFEKTHEKEEPFKGDDNEFKVRIGDTLGGKINELIAKTQPDEDWDIRYNYSYEIIEKNPIYAPYVGKSNTKRVIGMEILYGWKEVAKPDKVDEINREIANGDSNKKIIGQLNKTPVVGPVLLWKTQSNSKNAKSLISFDIDLKMMDFASEMVQGEFDRKLSQFSEGNWDDIVKVVSKASDKTRASLSKDISKLSKADIDTASEELVWDEKSDRFLWIFKKEGEDDVKAQEMMVDFNKVLKTASNNVPSQMQAIISSNLFKAKARIIGDPTFGSVYNLFKIEFHSNFAAVGYFAHFFQRKWLLTKVAHKIDESGYFTDLELVTLPTSPFPDSDEKAIAEEKRQNIQYGGTHAPSDYSPG